MSTDAPGQSVWRQIWDACVTVSPVPGPGEVIGAALIAVTLLALPRFFPHVSVGSPLRWPKFFITQTHEGMHAVTAALCGHGVTAIRLEKDHSGTTHTIDYGGFGSFLVAVSGYFGPGLVALGIGGLVIYGYAAGAVALYAVGSAVMLVFMRNTVGLTFVAAVALAAAAVVWWAPSGVTVMIALTVCWYLVAGGVLTAVEQFRIVRDPGRQDGSDADSLKEITGIPATLWATVHVVGALALVGAMILLSIADLRPTA